MALLELSDIWKTFNGQPALAGVDLSLEKGEILCLLGPSGCGKTTLLRIVAGLETADRGRIIFDGCDLAGVLPHHRQFGMMFQEYALFPHKNVFQNVAFGLQVNRRDQARVLERTREVLQLVGLSGMEKRPVDELSGGERQRVALARSLAPSPRLLMLDEPLGSLDRALRERLIIDLHRILKKVGVSAVFVTHDQGEAFAVADRIAVFNSGRIEQIDPPESLYKHPANRAVARFLGFQNLMTGTVIAGNRVRTDIGTLPIDVDQNRIGQRLNLLVRPEGARVLERPGPSADGRLVVGGRIVACRFQGASYQVTLTSDSGRRLVFSLPNDIGLPPVGQTIQLALSPAAVVMIG